MAKYRILIADDERQVSRRLHDFLVEKNFDVQLFHNGKDAKEAINVWQPHFVICDLVLPEVNAVALIQFVRSHPGLSETKMIITSSHNSPANVRECIKSGAQDYVVKPYKFEDLFGRLVFHLQKKKKVEEFEAIDATGLHASDRTLHLLGLVMKEATSPRKTHDIMFNTTKMLALALSAVRCSVIECSEDRQVGIVRVSSDDRKASGIQLDLNRYPEVVHVLNTEKMVVIENLDGDPVMAEIKKQFRSVNFNALVVAPLIEKGRVFGVVSARMAKEHSTFNDRDIRFVKLLSQVQSMVIGCDATYAVHPANAPLVVEDPGAATPPTSTAPPAASTPVTPIGSAPPADSSGTPTSGAA